MELLCAIRPGGLALALYVHLDIYDPNADYLPLHTYGYIHISHPMLYYLLIIWFQHPPKCNLLRQGKYTSTHINSNTSTVTSFIV